MGPLSQKVIGYSVASVLRVHLPSVCDSQCSIKKTRQVAMLVGCLLGLGEALRFHSEHCKKVKIKQKFKNPCHLRRLRSRWAVAARGQSRVRARWPTGRADGSCKNLKQGRWASVRAMRLPCDSAPSPPPRGGAVKRGKAQRGQSCQLLSGAGKKRTVLNGSSI